MEGVRDFCGNQGIRGIREAPPTGAKRGGGFVDKGSSKGTQQNRELKHRRFGATDSNRKACVIEFSAF